MKYIHGRAARLSARSLVVPAAALVVLAVTAPQAAAHTELDSSSPGANAALSGLPPRVTLTFSDEMTQKYAKVAVTGPDGQSAGTGEPQVRGKSVSLPVDVRSPAGRYTVGYRVVSADGHPVSGSYTFTVRDVGGPSPSPRAAESADGPSSPAARRTEAAEAAEEPSDTNTAVLVGGGVLALVAAAVGGYTAWRKRARRGD
ncbi:copper resistance CopC family protein (plasmid) [Streptomyces sp. G6]|uniref:copper resistance CopC family protein n=1 Tax=Streptomyces sp. G6 TaxID=1178736 RepID=UPI003EDB3373